MSKISKANGLKVAADIGRELARGFFWGGETAGGDLGELRSIAGSAASALSKASARGTYAVHEAYVAFDYEARESAAIRNHPGDAEMVEAVCVYGGGLN